MSEAEHPMGSTRAAVDRTIDPADGMLDGEQQYYFDSGRSALRVIQHALSIAEAPEPRRILDLPCGHGRVLRYLRTAYPEAELSASDVLESGVSFCRRQFGARGIVASVDPAATVLEGEYDLIWCGSLLTHLPIAGWEALGSLFARHLAPGGVLVSTLHGRWAATRLRRGDSYGLNEVARQRLLEGYEREGFA